MNKEELKKISMNWYNKLSKQVKEDINDLLQSFLLKPEDGIFVRMTEVPGVNLFFVIDKDKHNKYTDNRIFKDYLALTYLDQDLKYEEILVITDKDLGKDIFSEVINYNK